MRRTAFVVCLFVVCLILVVVAVWGCGGSKDTSSTTGETAGASTTAASTPASSTTTTVDDGTVDLQMVAPTVIDVPAEEVAKASISSAGGVLQYGPVKVEVPSGAVSSDTTVSITRLDAPFHSQPSDPAPPEGVQAQPLSLAFDFGPAGLKFERPVTVTLPYDPGVGAELVDPATVAIAYWNGEAWAIAGGTADPATRTVSVQLKEFEGSILVAAAIGVAVGAVVHQGVKWWYGPEAVKEDPVSENQAKNWVTPDDTVVKDQAAKAVIMNPVTKETKTLNDPGLGDWVAGICKDGVQPALAYKNPDGSVTTSVYDAGRGSNWQKPADYFTRGTEVREVDGKPFGGPLHGDCTDLTNATVSVFKAAGLPAKGVLGYGGGGSNKNSVHAWGEVVIGDSVYRIDEGGGLRTPDNDAWHFGNYKPITDPSDPRAQSMWDDKGQQPYKADWWTEFVKYDLNGHWTGTFTITEVSVTDEDVEKGLEEQGCSFNFLEELKGVPLPMTMDITLDETGKGTATWQIDTSSLKKDDGSDVESKPTTNEVMLVGDRLTFRLGDGDGASMAGTVSKKDGVLVLTGTLSQSGEGFYVNAAWTVKKE